MARRTLWVRCPACDSKLEVDERDGRVLRQQRGGRAGADSLDDDWSAALARAKGRGGGGEDKLEAALARERSKETELEDLFSSRVGGLPEGDDASAASFADQLGAETAAAWRALERCPAARGRGWQALAPGAEPKSASAVEFGGLESVWALHLAGGGAPALPERWQVLRAEGDLQPMWSQVIGDALASVITAPTREEVSVAFAGRSDLDLALAECDARPAAAAALLRAGEWVVFTAFAARSDADEATAVRALFGQACRWAQAADARNVVLACSPGSEVERLALELGAHRLGHRALLRPLNGGA